MKPPKRFKPFLIAGMVVLLAALLWSLLMPEGPLDLSKEEDLFQSISMPPQAVYASGYMDGGSVGVLIVDHLGARHELSFPIDYDGIRNPYPTAYFGNLNDPKMIPFKNPERARQIAIRLIDESCKEGYDPRVGVDVTARARRTLSSRPDVVAGRAYDKLLRYLKMR